MAPKGKKKSVRDSSGSVKGKKGKKRSKSSEGDAKGKGKGKGKGKRRSSRKSKNSVSSAVAATVSEPLPSVPSKPEIVKPVCNDLVASNEPCRYTEDACCKEAIACRPNRYPGLLCQPQVLAVVGSECGSYDSLCKLLRAGFRCADRVLTMTPWGNYVIFRCHNGANKIFFLFDGCSCNVNRFRFFDLSVGTAGLLYFEDLHCVIDYIIESRQARMDLKNLRKSVIDEICREFCEYGDRHSGSCN